MTGVKVSEYTVAATLNGTDKIPLGTGIRKATTPDQLAAYIGDIVRETLLAPSLQKSVIFDDFLDIKRSKLTNTYSTLEAITATDMASRGLDFVGAGRTFNTGGSGSAKTHRLVDAALADFIVTDFDKITYSARIYIPNTYPVPSATGNKRYIAGLYHGGFHVLGDSNLPCIAALEWSPASPFFRLKHSGNQFVATDVTAAQNTVYIVRIEWVKSTQALTLFINNAQKATATLSNYTTARSVVSLFGSQTGEFAGTEYGTEIWADYLGQEIEYSADRF